MAPGRCPGLIRTSNALFPVSRPQYIATRCVTANNTRGMRSRDRMFQRRVNKRDRGDRDDLKCAWESHRCSTGIEVSVRGLEDHEAFESCTLARHHRVYRLRCDTHTPGMRWTGPASRGRS